MIDKYRGRGTFKLADITRGVFNRFHASHRQNDHCIKVLKRYVEAGLLRLHDPGCGRAHYYFTAYQDLNPTDYQLDLREELQAEADQWYRYNGCNAFKGLI